MIKAEWTNKDALDLQPTCNQLATAEPKTVRDTTSTSMKERLLMDDSLIRRSDAIKALYKYNFVSKNVIEREINAIPSAEPKTGRDCTDFVRWLMDEVMDEENWQLNAVANGEIICRKLKKLGMLDVVDGYYVETQKTGKWIEVEKNEYEGFSIVNMRCNQCGRYAYLVLPKGTKCVYDYCPWCKADMRGEEE